MFAVPAQLYLLVQKMQINFIPDSHSRYFHVGLAHVNMTMLFNYCRPTWGDWKRAQTLIK